MPSMTRPSLASATAQLITRMASAKGSLSTPSAQLLAERAPPSPRLPCFAATARCSASYRARTSAAFGTRVSALIRAGGTRTAEAAARIPATRRREAVGITIVILMPMTGVCEKPNTSCGNAVTVSDCATAPRCADRQLFSTPIERDMAASSSSSGASARFDLTQWAGAKRMGGPVTGFPSSAPSTIWRVQPSFKAATTTSTLRSTPSPSPCSWSVRRRTVTSSGW